MNQIEQMTSSRPYLVRAIHEWIVDNGLTPYLIINAHKPGAEVPRQYVQNGKIILNVSPQAVRGFSVGNEWVEFKTRFGGRPYEVRVPATAVQAVYAKENGVGMAFQDEGPEDQPPSPQPPRDKTKAPKLKVVK